MRTETGGIEAGEELAIVEGKDRSEVVGSLATGAVLQQLGLFSFGVSYCNLQLNRPVGGQKSLDDLGLPVQEVIEDGPGGAQIRVAALFSAVTDLER